MVEVGQNRQRDAEQNRKLISELKQSVELLKNSNELLQDAISGEIGSLKDEVKENTVQEVRKALQANIEAIQRATKLSFFALVGRKNRGVLRHPPMGALCFVTLLGL